MTTLRTEENRELQSQLQKKLYTGKFDFPDQTQAWFKEGFLHNQNGPAVIYPNGDKIWATFGRRNRLDGPAVENSDGTYKWFVGGSECYNEEQFIRRVLFEKSYTGKYDLSSGSVGYFDRGFLHREEGPAIERANGDKEWFQHDVLHRTDGPAIERANGDKEWFQSGYHHREDGPAIELADGTKKWYIKGNSLLDEEIKQIQSTLNKESTSKEHGFSLSNVIGNLFSIRKDSLKTENKDSNKP